MTAPTVTAKNPLSDFEKLRRKVANLSGIENINVLVGKPGAKVFRQFMEEAEAADKELDLVHSCLTELYSGPDSNVPVIKECLDKIKNIRK